MKNLSSMLRRLCVMSALGCAGLALSGCGGMDPSSNSGSDSNVSSRADSLTAYQHLFKLGYFPNSQLAALNPEWRPIVPTLPADPAVVDAPFELALRKYQQTMGLEISGQIDAATLTSMQTRGCAHYDLDPSLPRRDAKFANYTYPWAQTNITYRFASSGELPGISGSGNSKANIRTGMNKWSASTNLTFQEVSSGENVRIQWGDAEGYSGLTGWDGETAVITFNNTAGASWTAAYLQSLSVHEWGHALTFDHSALTTAVMYPSATQLTLQDDDVLVSNALYNTWEQMPGVAVDIAITPKTGGGDGVWVIGSDAKQVFEWTGSAWTARGPALGTAAYHLSVDKNNRPWVADQGNTIRTWNGSTWVTKPGSGISIAAGPSGKIYSVTPSSTVQVLNSAQTAWTNIGKPSGQLIWSVTTDHSGNVYALDGNESIWLYSAGTWSLASNSGRLAWDVATGGGTTSTSYTWDIDTGDDQPAIWNHQSGADVGSGIPTADWWVSVPLPGGNLASTLAVGLHGRAWVVDTNGTIWRRREIP